MQWHWGNIGSMLAGLSTIVIAVGALIRGPAVVRAWLARQAADAEEVRAQAEALREEADERRLERRRTLLGWSPHGVEMYTVALVTDLRRWRAAVHSTVPPAQVSWSPSARPGRSPGGSWRRWALDPGTRWPRRYLIVTYLYDPRQLARPAAVVAGGMRLR
jgi:hypothetical protein